MSLLMTQWTRIERSYFPADGARSCFVETDSAFAGTPLWPHDTVLDTDQIARNVAIAHAALKHAGGQVIAGHLPQSSDREFIWNSGKLASAPSPLASTYVAAAFIPKTSILDSRIGYHVTGTTVPRLSDSELPNSGTWLLSNFGFFMTPKLLPTECSYLGGCLIQNANECAEFPPLFATPGIAITTDGKPQVIFTHGLGGGKCQLGDDLFQWSKKDVNPHHPGDAAIYTPENSSIVIGEGRLNIVIANVGNGHHPVPKILSIHDGAIPQPPHAIVLSLPQETDVRPDADISFELDPWWKPEINRSHIRSLYQGLVGLGPGEIDWSPWTHPNALKTQETFLPNNLRREPRAFFVETSSGFLMIAFSGRYEFSIGISWEESVPAIQTIIETYFSNETITRIIGLDGGSSVKLCLLNNGKILPLHWAAPGPRNRFGDPLGNVSSTMMLRVT